MKTTAKRLRGALVLGWVLFVPHAHAQETYSRSVPSLGAVLKEAPVVFSIAFTEAIYLTSVRLVSDDGTEWPIDWTKDEKDVFDVEFRATKPLPPGKYTIDWYATVRQHFHDDGGEIKFNIEP
jgi:methionine-rich copper-binding protein CopC